MLKKFDGNRRAEIGGRRSEDGNLKSEDGENCEVEIWSTFLHRATSFELFIIYGLLPTQFQEGTCPCFCKGSFATGFSLWQITFSDIMGFSPIFLQAMLRRNPGLPQWLRRCLFFGREFGNWKSEDGENCEVEIWSTYLHRATSNEPLVRTHLFIYNMKNLFTKLK